MFGGGLSGRGGRLGQEGLRDWRVRHMHRRLRMSERLRSEFLLRGRLTDNVRRDLCISTNMTLLTPVEEGTEMEGFFLLPFGPQTLMHSPSVEG